LVVMTRVRARVIRRNAGAQEPFRPSPRPPSQLRFPKEPLNRPRFRKGEIAKRHEPAVRRDAPDAPRESKNEGVGGGEHGGYYPQQALA
jgi:hypothetical protein